MWAATALAPRTTYLVPPTNYGQQPPKASWTLMHRAKVPAGTRSGDVRLVGSDYALVRRPTTTNSL
jgi:hypothetical protein